MYAVIAICGLKRSGKDMVANYISARHGHSHIKIASTLKQMTKIAFNLTDNEVESESKDRVHETWGVSPRVLMDFLGTHVFQHEIGKVIPKYHNNRCFWINQVLSAPNRSKHMVISDLRFEHEVDALRKHMPNPNDLLILRIRREGTDASNFVSEMESEHLCVDHEITNDGTLLELYNKVDNILTPPESRC